MKIMCIGGGAASFFFAANVIEQAPNHEIIIIEQGRSVLNKVLISGGGRCNVTHQCFDPKVLCENYPRGQKELLGPFHKFSPQDTLNWFSWHGVEIVSESDGRMFPESNTSSTIATCLEKVVEQGNVKVWTQAKVINIAPLDEGNSGFNITLANDQEHNCDILFIGAGSSPKIWSILEGIGHSIIPPVPSLFTFKCNLSGLPELSGVSVQDTVLSIPEFNLKTAGPLLFTHRGFSGPAVLKMSAWGARSLRKVNYQFDLIIDFLPHIDKDELESIIENHAGSISSLKFTEIPKRIFAFLLQRLNIPEHGRWQEMSRVNKILFIETLKAHIVPIQGQNRFKEEFVTAGGVNLKEINFKSFSSKLLSNLFLAGEILNIDAVTGGFNFQAAWTGAALAADGFLSMEKS